MNTNKPIRYFSYARKSTDDRDRQQRSLPDQLAEARDKALKENLQVVDILSESRTARFPGRPIFNDMLDRIERGEAEGIVVWGVDRLARNMLDATRVLDMLARGVLKDIKFCTCLFENTSAGRYMLAMLFCQATYYCDNLSDNVKRTFDRMFDEGLWPEKAPIGYLNQGKKKPLMKDPERAAWIRKAFLLYATGTYTLKRISDEFTKEGFRTRRDKTLSISHVEHILKNPFYFGLMRMKGKLNMGQHEPLISKELFDKVQAILGKKGPAHRHSGLKPYMYRGLFHCGGCGCLMTIETQKGHNYLRCTRKKGLCRQPFVREEAVIGQISESIDQLALPSEVADWLIAQLQQEQATHLSVVDAEIQRLRESVQAKSGQIQRLILGYSDGTLTPDEFRNVKNQVLLEKRDLEDQAVSLEKNRLGWLEPAIKFVKASKQAVKLLQAGDLTGQRDFFRKAGSNRKITNKQVGWEPRGAWKHVVNPGRFAHRNNAASCEAALFAGETVQIGWKLGD